MNSNTLLREAIAAYKAGQQQYARELFLELVDLDPANEVAWMWLSGLLDNREDQIKALENSLIISQGGKKVETRLHVISHHETRSELVAFRSAIKAIEAGQTEQGRGILQQIVSENKDHERAWMALSDLADDRETQVAALENVVRINPNNFKARERLTTQLHLLYQEFLSLGHQYQRQGELHSAIEAYKSAERYASSGSFRAAAQQRWQMLEQRGEVKDLKESPGTTRFFRDALGPLFIYLLLLVGQNAMSSARVSPLMWAGGLMIAVGSFIAAASMHAPNHRLWITVFGPSGISRPVHRSLLRSLGLLLVLIPYLYWLVRVIQQILGSGSLF